MKVFVGQSIWRVEDVEHSLCMRELVRLLTLKQIPFIDHAQTNDALIARSRNLMAMHFLKSDCDVLWVTDGDIVFNPEQIINLCQKVADDPEVSVCGGMYVTRVPPHRPALSAGLPEDKIILFGVPNQPLVEVSFMTTGCMAIHRRVFEKLKETMDIARDREQEENEDDYYPFFSTFLSEVRENWKRELSEDFAFAERAKHAGFSIWLDPSIWLGHVATHVVFPHEGMRPMVEPQPVAFKKSGDTTTLLVPKRKEE